MCLISWKYFFCVVYAFLNRKGRLWAHMEFPSLKAAGSRHYKACLGRCFAKPPSSLCKSHRSELVGLEYCHLSPSGRSQEPGEAPGPWKNMWHFAFYPSCVTILAAQCYLLCSTFKINYVNVCFHSTATTHISTSTALAVPLHQVVQVSIFFFGLTMGFAHSDCKPNSCSQTWTSSVCVSEGRC